MKMSPHQVPTLMIVLILVISCFECTMSDTECNPGQARLVNGTSDNNGVLEICLSNSNWSTVCYSYLGCNDFLVACRQAGFDNVLSWNSNRTAYDISKPEVGFYRCDGTEDTLFNCTQRQYTIDSRCYHRSAVTLTCTRIPDDVSCEVENDIRLYGGKNSSEGQIQICSTKQWRDVCAYRTYGDDLYNYGHIACTQLGYNTDDHWISVTANGHFYKTNSTWSTKFHYEYYRLWCHYKGATSFSSCWSYGISGSCGSTCYGLEVAVTCTTPAKTNCKEKDVRLVGGQTKLEGWVEVCMNGIWGRVNGKIEGRTQDVICSTLGFNDTGSIILSHWSAQQLYTSIHSPRLVKYINCCDRDKTFSTCDMHLAEKGHRATSNDLAIRCVDGCTHGRMRLSGGDTEHEGNVEVCVSGTWRGVGLSEWDEVDANVVCQHLYPGKKYAYAIATNSTVFEGSSRAVYYDQLECGGAETSIYNCNKQQQSSILTGPTAAVYCKPLCDCN